MRTTGNLLLCNIYAEIKVRTRGLLHKLDVFEILTTFSKFTDLVRNVSLQSSQASDRSLSTAASQTQNRSDKCPTGRIILRAGDLFHNRATVGVPLQSSLISNETDTGLILV
jgi:hypothetical protein